MYSFIFYYWLFISIFMYLIINLCMYLFIHCSQYDNERGPVGVETDIQTLQSIQSHRLNLANAWDTLAAKHPEAPQSATIGYEWRDADYTRRALLHAGHQIFHLLWAFLFHM